MLILSCFMAVAYLASQSTQSPIKFQEYADLLKLGERDYDTAFGILDFNKDNKIDKDDIKKFFVVGDIEFIAQKFMDMVDEDKKDGISLQEITTFMQRTPVRLSAATCHFIATNYHRICLADQILSHVFVAMDSASIDALFTYAESKGKKDQVIDLADVKAMGKNQLSEDDAKHFLEEIAGDSDKITAESFKDYMGRADVNYFLRECWKVAGGKQTYDNECAISRLIDYTRTQLTDTLLAAVFNDYDANVKDKVIDANDFDKATGMGSLFKYMIELMDQDNQSPNRITFHEFRLSLYDNISLRMMLEKTCLTGKFKLWSRKLKCLKAMLLEIVSKGIQATRFGGLDLSWIHMFEDLDKDDNGKISARELQSATWNKNLALKFIREVDGPDVDKEVNLDEFTEYMATPNMEFAIFNCFVIKSRIETHNCQMTELKDTVSVVLEKKEVNDLFLFYSQMGSDEVFIYDLREVGVEDPAVYSSFIDKAKMQRQFSVMRPAFTWFVKRRDVSDQFAVDKTVQPAQHKPIEKIHEELMKYASYSIDDVVDISILYSRLELGPLPPDDIRNQIGGDNFKGLPPCALDKIAILGETTRISIQEFWLYLHADREHPIRSSPEYKPLKRQLEESCKDQRPGTDKVNCFISTLKELTKNC